MANSSDCALSWISHYIQKLNITSLPVTINLLLHVKSSCFYLHRQIRKMREEFYQGIFQGRPKSSDTGGNNHNALLLTWKRRFMSYAVGFNSIVHLYCIDQIYWNDLAPFPQLAISESSVEVLCYETDNKPKMVANTKQSNHNWLGHHYFSNLHPARWSCTLDFTVILDQSI